MTDSLAQQDARTLAQLDASIRVDMGRGIALDQIVASLEAVGWTHEEAAAAVAKADGANQAEVRRRNARQERRVRGARQARAMGQVALGAAMLVLGLGLTVGSLMLASKNNGFFVITYGLIISGAAMLLTGLTGLGGK